MSGTSRGSVPYNDWVYGESNICVDYACAAKFELQVYTVQRGLCVLRLSVAMVTQVLQFGASLHFCHAMSPVIFVYIQIYCSYLKDTSALRIRAKLSWMSMHKVLEQNALKISHGPTQIAGNLKGSCRVHVAPAKQEPSCTPGGLGPDGTVFGTCPLS